MDVCCMLLERLWQFDHHVVHDGYENTYSLRNDGFQHKLKPLKETEEKVCSNARIYLFDGRKFLEGMKHDHIRFSSIPKVDKEEVEDVSIEVVDMLDEFQDIVSDNVSDGLPPMRKIIYQMDLIPRANFLNKVAHIMTLVENEELNMQVQELLQKGLIQESLSPYAVHVVLAPKKNAE
ncbi:uncharacterized protein LOC131874312 [Cryptomeria japonica]|uniref:uncharacterized protein LOC131874312 n=1 Tax=Cryptomeria japonica TaxID=3369 RepID=UPI0027DAA241|nr:uncharacterized protein LOC131874312 [Cryptomeria japonica]